MRLAKVKGSRSKRPDKAICTQHGVQPVVGKRGSLVSKQHLTTTDGIRIMYEVIGQGPVIMLLHGAGKTRKDWNKVGYVDRLKVEFKIINVDIRGSGESDCLTRIGDYDIERICTDLDEIAKANEVEEAVVWGYSFGGSIARYLGAWSDWVKAIVVVGVPFGRAVDDIFDRYIDEFIQKYGSLAKAYNEGTLDEKGRKSAIKGRIPVWVACFQATRAWPSIEASDVKCAKLLLAGTRNKSVMDWLEGKAESLQQAGVQVELVEGLNHQQEFSQIDRVYPIVESFLRDSQKLRYTTSSNRLPSPGSS